MEENLKVFSGNANLELAKEICDVLQITLGKAFVGRFSDGEIQIKIEENVRGCDVFIVQSTFPPAENLFELLLMIDAVRRSSAKRITAVIPYYGYARQDKKDKPRVPISAKVIANLLESSGADRILTIDLHVEQIQGFFDIPVDHLYAAPVFIEHLQDFERKDLVVVSPDPGRVNRARAMAKRLGNLPIAIIDKRRPSPNIAEVMNVVGEVKGKNSLIIDDIVDSGGTIIGASEALKREGALKITACCTHPLLSGNASEKLQESKIEEMIVTNTISIHPEKRNAFLQVLTISNLLGEAIHRIHTEQSVSTLFV
ncbi:ribose-phosphate pyrophosphokinase [candidate division TA06 bacterium]|nr:ribose-phosphate pyrophosphokinase [candidate division TA06 bacterium]